ncbi:hypothetical protein A2U01_0057979, partial [Trifolium medium]|nr:hypothetical protein [Trifolium medium]
MVTTEIDGERARERHR